MLSNRLRERIEFVAGYIGDATTDWLLVKKHILYILCNDDRKLFSRRHFSTKKQIINSFENEVINFWKDLTGVLLILDESRRQSDNWIHKPSGHALIEINAERKRTNYEFRKKRPKNTPWRY